MKMKVILFAAMTVNGYIARHSKEFPDYWSREDYAFFVAATKKAGNMVMGSKTYDTIPEQRKPLADRFVLVFSKKDRTRQNIENKLEYWDKSPKEALEYMALKGFDTICLVGGSEINTLFVKENLVDEMYLTLEPLLFGKGVPLFQLTEFEKRLELLSCKKLNSSSLLLHYKII